jgi:uncharacterized protein (TIGR02246 family)
VTATRGDEAFVRAALAELDAAFMAATAASFEKCFEPDVVFVGSGAGEEAAGRGALLDVVRRLASVAQSATFEIDWLALRSNVSNDIALVDGHGVVRATGSLAHLDGTRYRMTGVLTRVAGSWRWRVYHGSEPSRMPS